MAEKKGQDVKKVLKPPKVSKELKLAVAWYIINECHDEDDEGDQTWTDLVRARAEQAQEALDYSKWGEYLAGQVPINSEKRSEVLDKAITRFVQNLFKTVKSWRGGPR